MGVVRSRRHLPDRRAPPDLDVPDYAPAVALLLVGAALLAAPGATYTEPPEYRFEVSTPEAADHRPTSTVAYEDLSGRSKEVFRAALDDPDGEHVVRGEANAPDDIDYVTDYYPSPGVFNVTYQGEQYVMVAHGSGVNIFAGLFSMVVRAFGVFSAATGLFALVGRWNHWAVTGQATLGAGVLGIGFVAPVLFGQAVVKVGVVLVTLFALVHTLVTAGVAVRRL